jgi:hypothetical protein
MIQYLWPQKRKDEKFFPPSSFGAVVGSGIDKNQDPGSGINIPDPQHCILHFYFLLFLNPDPLSVPGILCISARPGECCGWRYLHLLAVPAHLQGQEIQQGRLGNQPSTGLHRKDLPY